MPRSHVSVFVRKMRFFISGFTYHPHVSGENNHRKLIFSKTLSRVKIFENGGKKNLRPQKYPDTCGRVEGALH